MIANSILCHGNSRFLQKVYMTDVDVTGTTSFASVSAGTITATTSLVSSGTLSVTGASTLTGAVTAGSTISATGNISSSGSVTGANLYATTAIYVNSSKAIGYSGSGNTRILQINDGNTFAGGTYIKNKLTTDTFIGTTATIGTLQSENVSVTNVLKSNRWDLTSVAQLGGSFYISPTVLFPSNSGTRSLVVAVSGTTITLTITDPSITSTEMAGTTWAANSKVKVSGNINGVATGTLDGTVSSINTSTHVLTLSVTGSGITAGTYDTTKYNNLSVMLYQRRDTQSSNDYRVGIWMNCYDASNSSATMRIYGGTSANPNVAIGNLTGMGLPAVNGSTPTGWSLYAADAYLTGTVVANGGKIGDWVIGTKGMYYSSDAPSNSSITLIPTGTTSSSTPIGGSSGSKQWVMSVKDVFGIDTSGNMYSKGGKIGGFDIGTSDIHNGTDSMSSTTAGIYLGTGGIRNYGSATQYVNITGGKITALGVDLSGSITASSGTIGGITANSSYGLYTNSKTTATSTNTGFLIHKDGAIYLGAYNSTNASCPFQVTSAGVLTAKSGTIGGWNIGATSLYSSTHSAYDTNVDGIFMDSTYIAGGKQAAWYLKNDGSAKIGAMTLTSAGVLSVPAANISGTLTSSQIDASGLTIAESQVTNLTTDLGNKASTSSVTTLSNKVSAVYGTSSTTATTQEKAVTCSNFEYFAGALITVKFSTANTYATAKITMNVNSKGAKDVWVANAVTSSTNQLLWGANAVITFRYDGTQFVVVGEPRNWYGASTTAAATAAKTDTTAATGCVVCKGTVVSLSMTNNNTATSPTLNINGTGAKNLYAGNSTTRPLASNGLSWTAGSTASFIFDGQYWRVGETAGLASAYAANTAATNAAKTASNYITTITGGGIKVSYTTSPTSYTQITADGTSIYQNSSQVANFGSTATIGPSSGEHVYIDSDSVDIMNGNTVLASFGSNSVVNNILATSGSISGFHMGNNRLESVYYYEEDLGDNTYMIYEFYTGINSAVTNLGGEIPMFYTGHISDGSASTSCPDPGTVSSWTQADWDAYRTACLPDIWEDGFLVTCDGKIRAAHGSVLGKMSEGHVTINNNEFDMSYGNSSILKFSYGSGNSTSGTAYAPYYSLGTRATNSDVGNYSCVFGYSNTASGYCSTAEGFNNVVTNMYSHVEGNANTVSGGFSHCEGSLNTVSNSNAHAEGSGNTASGIYSHVEGNETTASANSAHAEGYKSVASGKAAHAEGNSQATGQYSHAEGSSMAIGAYSHAQGNGTIVSSPYNTVIGKYNKATVSGSGTTASPYTYSDVGDYAFIIGNGTADTTAGRSNALTVDWSGNLWVSGNLTAANIGTILTTTGTSPTTISAWTWTTLCSLSLTAGTYMIYGYVHDGPPNVNTLLRLITFENDTQTQRQVSLTGNVSFGANGSVAGICSTTQTRKIQLLVDNATAISGTSAPYRGEIIAVRIK